jgi:curved DNA-binding protein CbpA
MATTLTDDPYATLGLGPCCSDEAIQVAYRALARRYHPDLAGEGGTRHMSEINVAFDRIRTPARRAAFALGQPVEQPGPVEAPAVGPSATGSAGVFDFGRFAGWSIDQVARVDPGFLEWLEDRREGHRFAREIDQALRAVGFRRTNAPSHATGYRAWT